MGTRDAGGGGLFNGGDARTIARTSVNVVLGDTSRCVVASARRCGPWSKGRGLTATRGPRGSRRAPGLTRCPHGDDPRRGRSHFRQWRVHRGRGHGRGDNPGLGRLLQRCGRARYRWAWRWRWRRRGKPERVGWHEPRTNRRRWRRRSRGLAPRRTFLRHTPIEQRWNGGHRPGGRRLGLRRRRVQGHPLRGGGDPDEHGERLRRLRRARRLRL